MSIAQLLPDSIGFAYAREDDDDVWHGPYDTREKAIEHLLAEDWEEGGHISAVRAVQPGDECLDESWTFICHGPVEKVVRNERT